MVTGCANELDLLPVRLTAIGIYAPRTKIHQADCRREQMPRIRRLSLGRQTAEQLPEDETIDDFYGRYESCGEPIHPVSQIAGKANG